MTEAVETLDLAKYEPLEGKKVTLTYVLDGEQIEAEGVLMAVAVGQGVMFRKRGSQRADLVREVDVRSIVQIADAPKKVTAKKLKEVTLDDARAHLADRHGYKLGQVNGATPEQALLAHSQIDHTDLGHTHGEADSTDSTEADSSATE